MESNECGAMLSNNDNDDDDDNNNNSVTYMSGSQRGSELDI
jgi:hypothetical protein